MQVQPKLRIRGLTLEAPFPPEHFAANVAWSRGLHLPSIEGLAKSEKLAIVGSGTSLHSRFRELQDFDGEIWAINGAYPWLLEHGVGATFFSVDPTLTILQHSRQVRRAVLHAQVDRSVFEQILAVGGEIRLFDPPTSTGGFSATGAAFAAIEAGYKRLFFYGCECSFEIMTPTHVYVSPQEGQVLRVGVLKQDFFTRVAYYVQALQLAAMIRGLPGLEERSGGLLGAIVQLPEEYGIYST